MNGTTVDEIDGVASPDFTEKENEGSISQEEVGWLFVQSYYTYMNKDPSRLHQFYTRRSIMCHGNEGDSVVPLVGQQQINKKIVELDFQDCKVLVSNVDSQPSSNGGLVIQVLGEMSNRGGPSQKFVQTFFLAVQKSGYYVLNDIFRFLKEDVGSDYEDEEEAPQAEEAVSAPSADGYREKLSPPVASLIREHSPARSSNTPGPESIEQDEATIQEKLARSSSSEESPAIFIEEDEKPAVEVPPEQSQVDEVPPIPLSPLPEPEPTLTEVVSPPAETPAAPSGPVSWAALAASNRAAAALAASAPAPVAAPEPVKPVPAPVVKPVEEKRKTIEYHSAYIKGVTEKVGEKPLRDALSQFGHLKHFEVNRLKNCAFVDYIDAVTLKAALDAHTVTVGDSTIYIEERRRGGANNFANNANRANNDRVVRNNTGGRWDRGPKTNTQNNANGVQNNENRNRNRGPANKRPNAPVPAAAAK